MHNIISKLLQDEPSGDEKAGDKEFQQICVVLELGLQKTWV